MNTPDQLLLKLDTDRTGAPSTLDLIQTPHVLLIEPPETALTSCLESFLHSLCHEHSPQALSLLAIDLQSSLPDAYAGLPHLLRPVVTDIPAAEEILTWLCSEMMRRFDLLSQSNCPNLAVCNAKRQTTGDTPLPRIIILIPQVENLLCSAAPEVEPSLNRLLAISRAVGIHVILTTHKPSSLPQALTVNIPARITCH